MVCNVFLKVRMYAVVTRNIFNPASFVVLCHFCLNRKGF